LERSIALSSWLAYPDRFELQSSARIISIVALFSSLIIATDFALTPVLNVKLMDTLVFSSAYAFGFRVGAYIAVISELIWCFASPYGNAGYNIPFLVGGELIFAFAGYAASKIWGSPKDLTKFSEKNLFFGAILAICAFVWDFETNIGTALIASAHTFDALIAFEVAGIPFMILHEVSDFALGAVLAPLVIVYFFRVFGRLATANASSHAVQSATVN
jgi:hypothetical protein